MEKKRVYAPIKRTEGIGWKELKSGLCRIMQDYCGEVKQEETLRIGLDWLSSAKESEISMAYARNPHELGRTIEALAHVNVSEVVIHACLARKASSPRLGMNRLDYPDVDPPEWNKFLTIRQENEGIETGEIPFKYWLRPPYSATYEENYRKYCNL
jgi:succinate dehydrogenase/fumarate reductase flavoprotein subunit